jgi:hypothetical protein
VLCQFVVTSADTGRPIGLVVAYDADLHSGTVQRPCSAMDRASAPGWPSRGWAC